MEVLFALAGVLFAYTHHFCLVLALVAVFIIRPNWRFIVYFMLAFSYAYAHQYWICPESNLSKLRVMNKAVIEGYVVSVPNHQAHKTQFQFLIDTIDGQPQSVLALLSWYNHAPAVHTGDRWQLVVKLKKPQNLHNPGGFDYESWLSAKHIAWTGYIRTGTLLPDSTAFYPWSLSWLKWREHLGAMIAKTAPNGTTSSIVQALTLGLTNQINPEQWGLFRRTGTTHLMVISGAHIGLVAGLVLSTVGWFWRRNMWLCLRWPAPKIAALAGMIAALCYALIAGFAVPAQRSFWACAFAARRFSGNYFYSGWQAWRYAIGFTLIFEPHAVLMPGSYLSFLAVAILITVNQRWRLKGIRNMLLMQFACSIGLTPLTLFWFHYGSLTGLVANIFAIPLVGFLIVPLSLFTLILLPFDCAFMVMQSVSWLVAILVQLLTWVDALSAVNFSFSFSSFYSVFALMGGMLLLVILPGRTFGLAGILMMISVFYPYYPTIKTGNALVRVLDVGQGLAVLIQTHQHTLLYDTGDAFFQGSDMGQWVVLPVMEHLGINKLDAVVISHPDKDHYGGLHSIETAVKVEKLIVNDPDYYKRGFSCHEYAAWQWEGVDFRFFPIKKAFKEKNNTSCVLQISSGKSRILLTGDIEKSAEQYLVQQYGSALQSDVLLVAHHGSKTSSSFAFLKQVSPKYAIASIGFDNRFHFPHALTLETYKKLGIPFYSTEHEGMIVVNLTS